MNEQIVIGLMSGTSVDGIDAAAVKITGLGALPSAVEMLGGLSWPIPDDVKKVIFELFEDGPGSLKKLCLINMRLGQLFAEAANALIEKLDLDRSDVKLIGSHGQTLYHVAEKEAFCGDMLRGSLQTGEASVIAQETGIPVVSDFRVADIAAGGSGAPLVPFFDSFLAELHGDKTAFQNIGGIGNLAYFEKGAAASAFDTGPGNMIIDRLVTEYTRGKLAYDKDGLIGLQGTVDEKLLEKWMTHPYLSAPVPKSTGREEFGTDFYKNWINGEQPEPDLIRTAEEYTVRTITDAFKRYFDKVPEKLIVSGGGSFNPVIMNGLKQAMPETLIVSGDEAGISSEYKEAAAFALLAWSYLENIPNNIKAATGASRPVVMGKLSKP